MHANDQGMRVVAVAAMVWLFGGIAAAYDGPVEKKVFTLPTYTTVGGKTLKDVKVGYETYGKLNAAGDNAIFVPHFFSGNSHAAGKYKDTDAAFGYWDPIIGSGRPIDTDKYFVVSADALANLNTKDPNTTTTGPAIDQSRHRQALGHVVSRRDLRRIPCACTRRCSIRSASRSCRRSPARRAVRSRRCCGPRNTRTTSQRVVHVIGPGFDIHPYVIELVDEWILPIKLDPKWNNGDYYGRDEPLDGLAQGLKIVTISTRAFGWAEKTFGYKWADPAKDPAAAMDNRFAIEDTLNKGGAARAKSVDANSMIYTAKANQLYNLGDDVKKIKAKILFVPAASRSASFRRNCRSAPRNVTVRRAASRKSRSSKATAATSKASSTSRSRARRSAHSWRSDR